MGTSNSCQFRGSVLNCLSNDRSFTTVKHVPEGSSRGHLSASAVEPKNSSSEDVYKSRLLKTNQNQTKQIRRLEEELREKDDTIQLLEDTLNKHHTKLEISGGISQKYAETTKQLEDRVKQQEMTIKSLQLELKRAKEKNDTLLSRISAMASAKLTDGNANIADLSDENRPTKLAEHFSELYDNEWTDAFTILTVPTDDSINNIHKSNEQETSDSRAVEDSNEVEACRILHSVICEIYQCCLKKATHDLEELEIAMAKFSGLCEADREALKMIKDTRKKRGACPEQYLKQELKDFIENLIPDNSVMATKPIKEFLEKGLHLCWLMAVQDPPVFLDTQTPKKTGTFDGDKYRPYTTSGRYLSYIVWPTLYLCEGGSILSKGIAQGKAHKTNKRKRGLTRSLRKSNDVGDKLVQPVLCELSQKQDDIKARLDDSVIEPDNSGKWPSEKPVVRQPDQRKIQELSDSQKSAELRSLEEVLTPRQEVENSNRKQSVEAPAEETFHPNDPRSGVPVMFVQRT